MRKLLTVFVALCLLFAVGCAKKEMAPEMPPAPEAAPAPAPEPAPPAAPAATGGEVVKAKKAESDIGATVHAEEGEFVSSIKCDVSEGKGLLSFALANPNGETLVFRRLSPMESSMYQKNQIAAVIVNGRRLDVAKYCGLADSKEELASGQSTACSVEFVPDDMKSEVLVRWQTEALGEQGANQITFRAIERSEFDFICSGSGGEVMSETTLEE